MKSILSLLFILNFLSSVNGQNIASDSSKVTIVGSSPSIVYEGIYTGRDTIYFDTVKRATRIKKITSTEISYKNKDLTQTINILDVDSVFLSENTPSMLSTSDKHFGRHLKNVANLQIVAFLLPVAAILIPQALIPIGVAAVVLLIIQNDQLRKAGKQAIEQDQVDGLMWYPNDNNE
jgi:hypothetical protein